MTRPILAAAIAAAALIGWFALSVHRLARQLSVTADASQDATSQYDDSDIVGPDPVTIRFAIPMTRTGPIDWDGILSGSVIPTTTRRDN